MGYYKYVAETYKGLKNKLKKPENKELRAIISERKQKWREGPATERVERPTRIDQARKYGYKSKQGFITVRSRIRLGGARKSRPTRGRRPKRMGVLKITRGKSNQRIAEERANKKYPNMEVLGSYWVWSDGKYHWYEVVLVDPNHPAVISDKDVNWITGKQHRKRALRGLTPAGKRGRGLLHKGKGAEKLRPSIGAHNRKGK